MEELLKKVAYAGIGLATVATEKLTEAVDELVEKGKLSDSEGKQIVEDFFTKSDGKRKEFEDRLRVVGEEIVSRLDFLKNVDFLDINKRLEELEARLIREKKEAEEMVVEIVEDAAEFVEDAAEKVEEAAKTVRKRVTKPAAKKTTRTTRTKAKSTEADKGAQK